MDSSPILNAIHGPADVKALPADRLPALAAEIRARILETTSRNGGHVASNLGVVELTIAMLRAFSPPEDKILFDVSHQCYPFKLLTGRNGQFDTLRRYNGISGFQKRSESPCDAFGSGHAGNALSAAIGLAVARDLANGPEHVIAVVGDASFSNGITLEALNNLRSATHRLIVVLNDNEMSISRNVGSISRSMKFGRMLTSSRYQRIKGAIERFGVDRMRMGPLRSRYHRFESWVKGLFVPSSALEMVGLHYIGPIDGHDFAQLESAFAIARGLPHPVLLHVSTRKGHGFEPAERDPTHWHGVGPFALPPQDSAKASHRHAPASHLSPADTHPSAAAPAPPAPPTYSEVAGRTLLALAEKDSRIVVTTAAMGASLGLDPFARKFPNRFFDVGISEEHQTVFAAGMAASGLRPVVAVYSTFLQRAVDPVIHDVALQKLPVVFCIDRAGVSPGDGPTHHGVFDIPMLRSVPGLVLLQPRDEAELVRALHAAFTYDAPVAIRYPRARGEGVPVPDVPKPLPPGHATLLEPLSGDASARQDARRISLLALGDFIPLARATAEALRRQGHLVSLVDARFVRPLDTAFLLRHLAEERIDTVATFENGVVAGGFGSAVLEALADSRVSIPVHRVGWPDDFVPQASSAAELLAHFDLAPDTIAARILASRP